MRKVLFLGAGRRVAMAKRWLDRGYDIYSYETELEVPIAKYAKIVAGRKWDDEEIYNDISMVVDRLGIDLIIPFQDQAVVVCGMLKHWSVTENTHILSSDIVAAETCFNKIAFNEFIYEYFPEIYPEPEIHSQVILKNKHSFGSKFVRVVDYAEHLWLKDPDEVAQKYIRGVEYSVDSYFDRTSKWVDSVSRIRIRTGSSGEVVSSITHYVPKLIHWTKEVGECIKAVGPTNTQFIIEETTGKPYIIEMNARFGGGYTLSMEAGLDAVHLIEREYFENRLLLWSPLMWKIGMRMERAYEDIYFGGRENENSYRSG